jgi:hypothetical protein
VDLSSKSSTGKRKKDKKELMRLTGITPTNNYKSGEEKLISKLNYIANNHPPLSLPYPIQYSTSSFFLGTRILRIDNYFQI